MSAQMQQYLHLVIPYEKNSLISGWGKCALIANLIVHIYDFFICLLLHVLCLN